ncbi:MAG: hypothetical protein V3575_02985 [Candidatus Absconditabacteria bacterium]
MNLLFKSSGENSTNSFISDINSNISNELLNSLGYGGTNFTYNLYKYCKYQAQKSNYNELDLSDFIQELNGIVCNSNNMISNDLNVLFQILILEYLLVSNNNISYYGFTQEKKGYEKNQITFFQEFNIIKQFCKSNSIEIENFSFYIAYDFMKEFIPFYWSKYSNKFFYPDDLCGDLYYHCSTVLMQFGIENSKDFLLDIFNNYELTGNSHFNSWGKNEFYNYLNNL